MMLCSLILISGCHRDEPPAPTAEQAVQLNDAESMLNDLAKDQEGSPSNGAAVKRSPRH